MNETPPPPARIRRGGASNRRPAILAGLATGLAVFLVLLPQPARASLFGALLAQRALIGLLLLFGVIALSLVWSAGHRLDTWGFQLLNIRGYHPVWLDRLMWLATQLGNMATALISAVLFFLLNYHRLAAEVVFGTVTLWLLVETIKWLTDRTRPFLTLEGTRVIGWRELGRSFPSGHTAQTFFLMSLLTHRFEIGIAGTIALYALAVLVGLTRMYVGAHYPRDVIGGAVLGSVWGALTTLVDPYWFGLRF